MIQTTQLSHVLLIEIVGPARITEDVLARSLAILFEVVSGCETFDRAKRDEQVSALMEPGRLILLFREDFTAPVKCAVELWELLREMPTMSVRMAIHSGEVRVEGARALGAGLDEMHKLVESGKEGQILMTQSYAQTLKEAEGVGEAIHEEPSGEGEEKRYRIEPQRMFLAMSGSQSEAAWVVADALRADGHETTNDGFEPKNVAWARALEERIRSADTVVAFVPDTPEESEFLEYQIEIAMDEQRKRGRPHILPVWLNERSTPSGSLFALSRNLGQAVWHGPGDNARVVSEVRTALASGLGEVEAERLEPGGGAVPIESKFYVRRSADNEFEETVRQRESIILVKGPRQIGKTSLISRGIEMIAQSTWRTALTDFQKLSNRQLDSEEDFYRVVALSLCRDLGFKYDFDLEWLDVFGPNLNFDNFVRALLEASELPLVWFIDEADRLFSAPYAADFFGLVRSWHNGRATDRRGPWGRLTLVIGYATEAHLFIKDLNQSPFNVGVTVQLDMFLPEDVADLNERYGRPVKNPSDLLALHRLLGGQPFLVRRSFDLLTRGKIDFPTLLATADQDDGPFADHLRRVLVSVSQLPAVWDALAHSFVTPELPDSEGLQRLLAAGVLMGRSGRGYELPCELYRRYLSRFIPEGLRK